MVDDNQTPRPEDLAQFMFTKRPVAGQRQLRITYRGVQVAVSWPEGTEGEADVSRLFGSWEALFGAAKKEIALTDELRNMDQEIADLLGGDGA